MAILEQKLYELLKAPVEDFNCELLGIELHRSGRHLTVRLYIDKEDGVSIDDCSDISHQVSAVLDVEDPIKEQYSLEVSSPGLSRPLFKLAHYQKFLGQEVCLHLTIPILERRKWQGKLEKIEEDMITLIVDEEPHTFLFGNIQKANIVAKF